MTNHTLAAKHSRQDYEDFRPFDTGKSDITYGFYRVEIVKKTRKAHDCGAAFLVRDLQEGGDIPLPLIDPWHAIPVGSMAWKEVAQFDGKAHSNYCCMACIDALLDWEKRQDD